MSQQQLTIPSSAECPKCDLKVNTQELVYNQFGLRMLDGVLKTQSQCKKCRKQVLSKELREKYNSWKISHQEALHKDVEKIKANHDKKFNENRDGYKIIQTRLTDGFKEHRDRFQNQFITDCENKKSELEKSGK